MSDFLRRFLLAATLVPVVWTTPVLSEETGPDTGEEIGEFDDFDDLYLGKLLDVVYTAAKHEQDIGESPSAITVITRADIEASGATTIPDLLRIVPGMDVVITSPMIIGIMARLPWGNENNQFLVLIDGREVNLELLGMSLWEIEPITLDDVERIEIIRGPGSALYGANAVAGVVNITTRAVPETTSGWVRLGAGEVGMAAAAARASTRAGNWGFSLSGGGNMIGTFANPRASGMRLWRFRALAEHRWSDSKRLLIDGGVSEGTGMFAIAAGSFEGTLDLRTLRLAYESEDLRGHLYWSQVMVSAEMDAALDYSGIRLAEFIPFEVDSHSINGEIQWTLPELWQPLLLIAGGGGRFTYLTSDQFLDADTFTEITSGRFHEPGIDHLEARAGAFVHGELKPVDWLTVTGGLRFDYNTETEEFLSPRLSAVFRPAPGHYLRLGVARAFRKPAFIETRAHLMVEFPDESPITGAGQDQFLEFMTRVLGNSKLDNEELLAFEAGYLGRFLDGKLRVTLDLYYNHQSNEVIFRSHIVPDGATGLPDLGESSFTHYNREGALGIVGSELSVRLDLSDSVSLRASWAYREVIDRKTQTSMDESPMNLITLGGRFRTDQGLVGSLYIFSRSEFWNRWVQNPDGLLEPLLAEKMENVFLVLGKLGWRLAPLPGVELETGVKLFLPVSFSAPYFQFREDGGGIDQSGHNFGGDLLCRMVSLYLQGSF